MSIGLQEGRAGDLMKWTPAERVVGISERVDDPVQGARCGLRDFVAQAVDLLLVLDVADENRLLGADNFHYRRLPLLRPDRPEHAGARFSKRAPACQATLLRFASPRTRTVLPESWRKSMRALRSGRSLHSGRNREPTQPPFAAACGMSQRKIRSAILKWRWSTRLSHPEPNPLVPFHFRKRRRLHIPITLSVVLVVLDVLLMVFWIVLLARNSFGVAWRLGRLAFRSSSAGLPSTW